MDWFLYFGGLVFVAWAFFRVGHAYGHAEGSWGPGAIKRITAAREDAYANGVRAGRGVGDAHRDVRADIHNLIPAE